MKKYFLLTIFLSNIFLYAQKTEIAKNLKEYSLFYCLEYNYKSIDSNIEFQDVSPSVIFELTNINENIITNIKEFTKNKTINFSQPSIIQDHLDIQPKANTIFLKCMSFYQSKELDKYIKKLIKEEEKKISKKTFI